MPTTDTSPETSPADRHAAWLLAMLDTAVPEAAVSDAAASDAAVFDAAMGPVARLPAAGALADWAASGAMELTGRADGPPLAAPGYAASAVRGALAVFAALSGVRGLPPGAGLPGAGLLGERAALIGLRRRGPWSAGGAFRALRTCDGWVGVSLARPEDRELVPALVEEAVPEGEHWSALTSWTGGQTADAAAERAQLLGIPAAPVPGTPGAADDEQAVHRAESSPSRATGVPLVAGGGGPRRHLRLRPLVIDLTSLWAGPLCASLLGLAGARVVKVESTTRPDGARFGPPAFYDLLHAGHASVALDLTSPDGRDTLVRLMAQADLVLEASRPRALRQLGIDADEIVAAGTTWLSITAYGRTGPWSNRVGFGDDVAAGAGLVVRDRDQVLPCGDASADPLTGVHAAVAAAAALRSERAYLLDVSMRDVTAVVSRGPVEAHHARRSPSGEWQVETADGVFPVRAPYARRVTGQAAPQGADTERTLARSGEDEQR